MLPHRYSEFRRAAKMTRSVSTSECNVEIDKMLESLKAPPVLPTTFSKANRRVYNTKGKGSEMGETCDMTNEDDDNCQDMNVSLALHIESQKVNHHRRHNTDTDYTHET